MVVVVNPDDNSTLSMFRGGNRVIIRIIASYLHSIYSSSLIHFGDILHKPISNVLKGERAAIQLEQDVKFPSWTGGINVNMMPFIMSKKESLPSFLHSYWPLIAKCVNWLPGGQRDLVGYLTVQESHVEAGETQRRPGLHTESPGYLRLPCMCLLERIQVYGTRVYLLKRSLIRRPHTESRMGSGTLLSAT